MDVRVLIADDQRPILDSLELLLKPLGYQVETVGTPEEGLNLLQRIEAIDSTLPVVVMTAWGSVEVAVEAMRGPLRDFVLKPWDNQKMLEMLRRQIERGQEARVGSRELREAREIQRRLLPRAIPGLPGYTIATAWEPARSVGGDYFDILDQGSRTAFCIGDVVGKGLPAALLMSNVQATVRVFDSAEATPAEVCDNVNRVICGNIAANKFISFFYGVLDKPSGQLAFTNAGHNPPILVRADGTVLELEAGGVALGIDPTVAYKGGQVQLQSGDRLLLFTDGLTEAAAGDALYGKERLHELLSRERALDCAALLDRLVDDVRGFARDGLDDDVTGVLIGKD